MIPKVYLTNRTNEGKCNLAITFTYKKNTRLQYSLGISIDEKSLTKDRRVKRSHPYHEYYNKLIDRAVHNCLQIRLQYIDNLDELTPSLFKKLLRGTTDRTNNFDLVKYLLRSENLSDRKLLTAIQKYEFKIVAEDYNSISDFRDYISNNYSNSTGTIYLRSLKRILKQAYQRNLISKDVFNSNELFQIGKFVTKPTFYLSSDCISHLEEIFENIQYKQLLPYVKLFLWHSRYSGQRYSDWHNFKFQAIQRKQGVDCIEFRQRKTKINVIIPLSHDAIHEMKELIEVPNYVKFQKKLLRISNIYYNKAIPDLIPFTKHQNITSHTARRSYATNLYLKGVPIQAIMAVTGHTTEKTFRMYIKADKADRLTLGRATL